MHSRLQKSGPHCGGRELLPTIKNRPQSNRTTDGES